MARIVDEDDKIYRTPTSTIYAAPGRNRWVRASSVSQARQVCFDSFGMWPVDVWQVQKVKIWESHNGT